MEPRESKSLEAHLTQLIRDLREDIKEFRLEFNEAIQQRVTHAEIAGFKTLFDDRIDRLSEKIEGVNSDLEAHKAEEKSVRYTDKRDKKVAVYGAIGALVITLFDGGSDILSSIF